MAVGEEGLLGAINQGQTDKFAPPVNNDPPPAAGDPPAADNNNPPPPPPPPAGDAPAPAAFNEAEYLKTNFGIDKLEDVKTTWSGLAQLQEQNKVLSAENEQYKPIVESFNKAGEVGKLFVEGIGKGIKPEILAQVYNLKPEALTDEQAWKYDQKLKHPNLTDGQINAFYNNKFAIEEGELDQNVIDFKTGQLAIEAQNARSGIQDYMGKTLNTATVDPAVAQAAVEVRTNQLKAQWEPALPALAGSLKDVTYQVAIPTFGAKAGEVTNVDFKYSLPEKDHTAIMQAAYQTAVSNGVVPDAKGMEGIKAYAHRLIWAEHGEKIAKAAVADAITRQTAQFEEVMNNPNLAKPVGDNARGNGGLNVHELSLVNLMGKKKAGIM